jgi:hypothetical protein
MSHRMDFDTFRYRIRWKYESEFLKSRMESLAIGEWVLAVLKFILKKKRVYFGVFVFCANFRNL